VFNSIRSVSNTKLQWKVIKHYAMGYGGEKMAVGGSIKASMGRHKVTQNKKAAPERTAFLF